MSRNTGLDKRFYDGNRILTMKDINGKDPEIYMITGNRSAGKTTFFYNWSLKQFFKTGKHFYLITRYKYELKACAENFVSVVSQFFHLKGEIKYKMIENCFLRTVLEDDQGEHTLCFTIAINSVGNVKLLSNLLAGGSHAVIDEFQSLDNVYIKDEFSKLIQIIVSISREKGNPSKRLPLIMLSNMVSLLNPYFYELKVLNRLRDGAKFIKGDKWVLEININEFAQNSINSNISVGSLDRDTVNGLYYLLDNNVLIENLTGKNTYVATVISEGRLYGLRYYEKEDCYYFSDRADKTYKPYLAVTVQDISPTALYNPEYNNVLRGIYNAGKFRFQNADCRAVLFNLLCYHY